jgi:hypothetical protein
MGSTQTKPVEEALEKQVVDVLTTSSKQFLLYKDGHIVEVSSGNAVRRFEAHDPATQRILALYRHIVR